MQYTFDITSGEQVQSATPTTVQLPKRLRERQEKLQKQPITLEDHQKRQQLAANKRQKVTDFVEKNKERQLRAMKNREDFARNFEFLGASDAQKVTLPTHLQERAQQLRKKWNTEDHANRMKSVLARREKLLAERQRKLQEHNEFAAGMPRKRNEMVPSLSDHLRDMAKVENRRLNKLVQKSQKAAGKQKDADKSEKVFETFGETKKQVALPAKLRKRAEKLKRKPATLSSFQEKMQFAANKRQEYLSSRTNVKTKVPETNMSNIQMWGARKANYVLPPHLQKRAESLKTGIKDDVTSAAAALDARMVTVENNRKQYLADRIAKAQLTKGPQADANDVVQKLKDRHVADMKKVNTQRSQFMENRVRKLQEHLRYVQMVQGKKKSQVKKLAVDADKDMEIHETNRQSFLSSVANKAHQSTLKGQKVNAAKKQYSQNFSMLSNQANRETAVPLPNNLQQRANALLKKENIPLDVRMSKAAANRQKVLQNKVSRAQGQAQPLSTNSNTNFAAPIASTTAPAVTSSVETKTEDQNTWKSRFLSFFS